MIVIVFGLPGSGKSFFAERLAGRMQAIYINSDRVRQQVIGDSDYTEDERLTVYEEMLRRAENAVLQEDADVVVDGSFYLQESRLFFLEALKDDANIYFIEIRAEEELIRERLAVPRAYSEADLTVYEKLRGEWEPMEEEHLVLQSGRDNIGEMMKEALYYIHYIYDGAGHE